MAIGPITVASLSATGGVGQITLEYATIDPNFLPYLRVQHVEIHSATSNNRALATKIADGAIPQHAHTGLATSETRYYWARAIDQSNNVWDWFPVSATGGVSATTSNTDIPAGSVGNTELGAGAVTSDKMTIGSLSSISANIGTVTAGTLNASVSYLGSVAASQISAGSLSAITATLGTVTSGTITSGTFQTASSGRRVRISSSDNYLRVFNGSGSQVGAFGDGHSSTTVLSINVSAISPAVFINNTSTGPALSVSGYLSLASSFSGNVAGVFSNSSTGGLAHGLRGQNTGGGGGGGVLGVSSTSGGYGVLAESGGIGPFTGAHDGFIPKDADLLPGDIVIDTGEILSVRGIDDAVGINAIAEMVADDCVYGVCSSRVPFEQEALLVALDPMDRVLRRQLAALYDRIRINSLGEGMIHVCGRNGPIKAGDLIVSSDVPGAGQKQHDDFMRSSTVAKAREAVQFQNETQVKRIACTYHCG